jgi:hypothetical protein
MDDNETPPIPMPDGELKEVAKAMYNLSSSLNGMALQVRTWTAAMIQLGGVTPQMRTNMAREIRQNMVDAGEQAARAIEPPPAPGS